jgi:putative membrane protein
MFYILLVKGFFIGIAFIVPGLSGGTLAVYLGIYDKLLHAIGNIFKEFKKSVTFLLPVFLGIGISVVGLAKLFSILLNWNSFIVLLFFIGLMIGGIKGIFKNVSGEKVKISSILSFVVAFGLIAVLVIFEKLGGNNSISTIEISFSSLLIVFLVGMAASMTMIVPGVSGSALLLVLGFYTAIVSNIVGNILDFSNIVYNLEVLIPFGLGAVFGIIIFSRIIEYSLKKYKTQTYYAILGFIIGSCIAIFFEIKDPATALQIENQVPIYENLFSYLGRDIFVVLGGIVAFVFGFLSSRMLMKPELKTK